MNPATTVGRHPLSSRFTAIVRVAYMDYPEPKELVNVYTSYLTAVLSGATSDPRWNVDKNVNKLANTLVDTYDQVKSKFSIGNFFYQLKISFKSC